MSYPIKSSSLWSDLAVRRGTTLHRSIEGNHYCKSNTRPSKDQKVIERTLSVFGKERNRSRQIQPSLSSCPVWVLSPQTLTFEHSHLEQNRKGNHKRIRTAFEGTHTRDFGIWASTVLCSIFYVLCSVLFSFPFFHIDCSSLWQSCHSSLLLPSQLHFIVRLWTFSFRWLSFRPSSFLPPCPPCLRAFLWAFFMSTCMRFRRKDQPHKHSIVQGISSNTLDMTNAWVTLVISSFSFQHVCCLPQLLHSVFKIKASTTQLPWMNKRTSRVR